MVPPADAWDLNGVAWTAGVSGDSGGSGIVGVATCTGRGCGGALGVGSVCCAWGVAKGLVCCHRSVCQMKVPV